MTDYQQKDNTGVLFRNDRKSSDTDPDYRGSATVGGEELWLNAWIKTSKNGNKFMSISLRPKQEPRSDKPLRDDLNDAVPF